MTLSCLDNSWVMELHFTCQIKRNTNLSNKLCTPKLLQTNLSTKLCTYQLNLTFTKLIVIFMTSSITFNVPFTFPISWKEEGMDREGAGWSGGKQMIWKSLSTFFKNKYE